MWGAFLNAGQTCSSIERVYVEESVADRLIERVLHETSRLKLGDPLDPETDVGPLTLERQRTLVEEHVGDALARGARLLAGGRRPPGPGYFYEPTVLTQVDHSMRVMCEESFGPLLPVRAVASDEEALAAMNASRFGLTASVWTRDADRAERLARELEAGTVFQNRCDSLDPGLAWTGVKDSGKGTTLSRYGFLHLTRPRSLHFRR